VADSQGRIERRSPPAMRIISTQRLVLEPQSVAHAEEMFRVLSDAAIYRFENAPPASLESLTRRFAKLERRRSPDASEIWLNWVIRRANGPLLGFVQATLWSHERARIAYVLSSAAWGQGFAREAVAAMLTELRDFHGVKHVAAVFKRENLPSRNLLLHLGFREEPLLFGDVEVIAADEQALYLPGKS